MDHLFGKWRKIKKKLEGKSIFIFLDYDGTLTLITQTPDKAILSLKVKNLIKKLIRSPRVKLAFISGRSLADLKKKIGIEGVIYVGNHGLEIEGPKIKFGYPALPGYQSALKKIKNRLNNELSHVRGVFVEDKGLVIALHYRLANKKQIPFVKSIFREITSTYTKNKLIKIKLGKMVFEAAPSVKWDKGKAVLWLLARGRFAAGGNRIVPVYIGDDKTDEDAFFAIKNKGLSIFVGNRDISSADYYLKNPREVAVFLGMLLED